MTERQLGYIEAFVMLLVGAIISFVIVEWADHDAAQIHKQFMERCPR